MVNAQEWLDQHYPKGKRHKITELNIGKWNGVSELEGDLDLSDFVNLEFLDCQHNKITSLTLIGLKKLEVVAFNRNLLTEFDYSSLNPEMLTELYVSDNNLSEQSLNVFKKLINLKVLWIGNSVHKEAKGSNSFFGSLQEFFDLKKLKHLHISNLNIGSDLENLPENLQYIFCDEDKENFKCKEIIEKLKDYQKKGNVVEIWTERKISDNLGKLTAKFVGNIAGTTWNIFNRDAKDKVYYDYQLWRRSNQIESLELEYTAVISALNQKNIHEKNDLEVKSKEQEHIINSLFEQVKQDAFKIAKFEQLNKSLIQKLSSYEFAVKSAQNKWNKQIESKDIINTRKELEKEVEFLMNNEQALKIEIIKLENEIGLQRIKIETYQKREASNLEIFAQWEQDQKKAEEIRKVERQQQYETIWENAQIKQQIERTLSGNNLERNQLFNQIEQLNSELIKTKINLELGQQDLITIQRLNFESKLKLQTILFLDATRTIMPSIFNNTLTTIEIGIFISNLTNNSRIQSIAWISLFLFALFSILLTTYKIFFSLFQKFRFFYFKEQTKKEL